MAREGLRFSDPFQCGSFVLFVKLVPSSTKHTMTLHGRVMLLIRNRASIDYFIPLTGPLWDCSKPGSEKIPVSET